MNTGAYKNYPIPRLVPCPDRCAGVERAVICLDGEWEAEDKVNGTILKIQNPHDMGIERRQGFSGYYEYRKTVKIPHKEKDRIILKFEGINGFATVYVEGQEIASHKNGFITWNVEITEAVGVKEEVQLRIEVDETADHVSTYSHGGMIHSAWIYILPEAYVNAVYLSPLFDEDMEICSLRVDMDASLRKGRGYGAELALFAPDGQRVLEKKIALDNKVEGFYTDCLKVENPVLWDAEHPQMYRLEITLAEYSDNGERKVLETLTRKTGLRRIERKGNRLFVNLHEVKLRGVCRHETSPRNGRALTRELIEQDIKLFKEANCNYIRTSHYPPSEYFLEQCDEHGIYVEDELALAFIARTLPYTQRDPKETERYLSHFAETMARDYNHPSVIIWSLCNESFGGHNFDLLNRFAHEMDPSRMTKFSYPMTIREEHEMPDIWSIHYSEPDADLAAKKDNLSVGGAPGKDMPVIHDEYVHVNCYNRQELRRDPASRCYWGESIRIFWDNIWNTEGALGGAIWAGIDETNIYDSGNTQLEWGIIDVWRRKKPEFYMTRKAYSPIKLLHSEIRTFRKEVLLILENRFCHTDFSEVKIYWKSGGKHGIWTLPSAAPGRTVKVILPFAEKADGPVEITFLDSAGDAVDEFLIFPTDYREKPLLSEENLKCASAVLTLREENGEVLVQGDGFAFTFRKESGLLKELCAVNGAEKQRILMGGPVLNVPYMKLGSWYLTSFGTEEKEGFIRAEICGGYEKTLSVKYTIDIYPDGTFYTAYEILHMEKHLPKQIKMRVGVDNGGLDELGIAYLLDPAADTLSWKRKVNTEKEGEVSLYPADHIARNAGTAPRFTKSSVWGEMPVTSWGEDMKDDILYGKFDVGYKGSNDFRSTKEALSQALVYGTDWNSGLELMGKTAQNPELSEVNLRLEVLDPEEEKIPDTDPRMHYTGTWYQVADKKESDHGTEMWSREKDAELSCVFTGTGIVWYGPQDPAFGMADVYIDGELKAAKISQRSAGCDFSCGCAGYDKLYHLPVYSVTDLPYGEHEIKIRVCGEKAEDASDYYVVIDYLRVLGTEHTEPVKLIVNQEFAYPHISWGNVRKAPILMEDGTNGLVGMKLVRTNGKLSEKTDLDL